MALLSSLLFRGCCILSQYAEHHPRLADNCKEPVLGKKTEFLAKVISNIKAFIESI